MATRTHNPPTRPPGPSRWPSTSRSVALLVALAVPLVGAFWAYNTLSRSKLGLAQTVRYPLGSAHSAALTLSPGTARLVLAGQASGENLLEGSVQNLDLERRDEQAQMRGNTAVYSLVSQRPPALREARRWPQWSLKLSPQVPLTLSVKNPISSSEINLRGLKVVRLEVDAQTGRLSLTLPDSGVVSAKVTGGGGRSVIRVPRNMAVRVRVVRVTSGIIEVFGRVRPTYTSPGFDWSRNRVDLEVIGGAGRMDIIRVR